MSAFTDHFSQFQIQLTEYTARVNVIEQGGDDQNLIVGELSILADVPELCSGAVRIIKALLCVGIIWQNIIADLRNLVKSIYGPSTVHQL